jgi:hypothetical protein
MIAFSCVSPASIDPPGKQTFNEARGNPAERRIISQRPSSRRRATTTP